MKDWVEDVRGQCLAGGIPFFFKQWGGFNKKKAGRRLCKERMEPVSPEGPCKLSGNSGVWFVMKLTEHEKRTIKLMEEGKPLPDKSTLSVV